MREADAGLKFEESGLSATSPVKYFVRTFYEPRTVRMHYHNSLELNVCRNVCRNVCGTIRFESGEMDLTSDCMLLIPPGIPHAYRLPESGGTIDVYHILTEELPGVETALGGFIGSVFSTGIRPESELLMEQLKRPGGSLLKISGTILLLVDLFLSAGTRPGKINSTSDSFLRRVIEYTEKNYHRRLSLDEISSRVGVSRFHFSRLFRQKSGENWSAYLNSLRMGHSLEYLADGWTVSDTALECGFESASYFISRFRDEFSITPLQWIKQQNSADESGPE